MNKVTTRKYRRRKIHRRTYKKHQKKVRKTNTHRSNKHKTKKHKKHIRRRRKTSKGGKLINWSSSGLEPKTNVSNSNDIETLKNKFNRLYDKLMAHRGEWYTNPDFSEVSSYAQSLVGSTDFQSLNEDNPQEKELIVSLYKTNITNMENMITFIEDMDQNIEAASKIKNDETPTGALKKINAPKIIDMQPLYDKLDSLNKMSFDDEDEIFTR